MSDFNFLPPPPPYWWMMMQPPGAPTHGDRALSLDELERHHATYKKWVERIEDDIKKKKDKDKDKDDKVKGFSARETFWIMICLSPVIGWGISSLYTTALNGILQNFGMR